MACLTTVLDLDPPLRNSGDLLREDASGRNRITSRILRPCRVEKAQAGVRWPEPISGPDVEALPD